MIDKSILDKVFPEPDLDKMKAEEIEKLQEKGFTITNFNSGGIFHTTAGKAVTYKAASVTAQQFISSACGCGMAGIACRGFLKK